MKKIFFLVLISLCVSGTNANVLEPRAYVSEILVDTTGEWTLELGFYEFGIEFIDSVRMFTSSGTALMTSYNVILDGEGAPFDSLAVITVVNLSAPLIIDPSGDFVRLVSYVFGDEIIDEVAFGDYPGSYLDCMLPGESVACAYWMRYCIDHTPTLGAGNNTSGAIGNYSGYVIDHHGNVMNQGYIITLCNPDLILYPDENGFFYIQELSSHYIFDTIEQHIPPYPTSVYTYTVQRVDFCLRPDSSEVHDIYATSLLTSVEDQERQLSIQVTVAPNPFSNQVVFYFNIDENNDDDLTLSIYSLDGRNIAHFSILPGQTRLEWIPHASTPSGTYIYRLEQHNNTLKTGKFVRL